MVDPTLVLGLRRIAPRPRHRFGWAVPTRRLLYEVRFVNGSAWVRGRKGIDELFDGARLPADFWATVTEADRLWESGDTTTLVRYATGEHLTVGPPRPLERFSTSGAWVVSSYGYRVRVLGRAGMEYQEGPLTLQIDSEAMAEPAIDIWPDSIPQAIRPVVVENVIRAWLWMGFDILLRPVP